MSENKKPAETVSAAQEATEQKTAGKTKGKKVDESLKGLSLKERREVLEKRREKRRMKLYAATAAVVAVCIAALLFWDSGIVQRKAAAVTIGDASYSAAAVDYYYYTEYNNMYYYASYYGLDTSLSTKEQEIYEGTTWYDYLCEQALSSLTETSALVQEGKKADYTISADGQASIDSAMDSLSSDASQYGISVGSYLSQAYGRFMNRSAYKQIITDYYYAQDYKTSKTEGFEVTDAEITDYYEENKNTLDDYDYQCYYISATPETQYDDDGNAIDATEAETTAALTTAKENADKLKDAMTSGTADAVAALVTSSGATDYSTTEADSFASYPFGEWLTDAERKAGDCEVVEDSTTDADEKTTVSGYYVTKFNSRARNDYNAANFRTIFVQAEENETTSSDSTSVETSVIDEAATSAEASTSTVTYNMDAAKTKADEIRTKWQDNGGTEDAFVALVADNSDDSGSSSNGGLYEHTAKGAMIGAVNNWLFADGRKSGDCEIVEDDTYNGYQILYFVGYDDLYYWQYEAKNALQSADYDTWYSEIAENYTSETANEYFYSLVGA